MMSKDLARAFDPALIAHDCGITPDRWQATLLRERPRRSLLLCSRQSGKSHGHSTDRTRHRDLFQLPHWCYW